MREKLEILLDELQHLKREGVNTVYCEENSLNQLKESVAKIAINKTPITLNTPSSETSTPQIISNPTAPVKKLNPFSPLPSDTSPTTPSPSITFEPSPKPESKQKPKSEAIPTPTIHIDLPKGDKPSQWSFLHDKVLNCTILKKDSKPNSKPVFGSGSLNSDIFLCGDFPGPEEESEASPLAGESGLLLTKILQAMGLKRDAIYMANIINWPLKPSTNFSERTPSQDEIFSNLPYLKAQIQIVQPKVIVALGATAVNALLGPDKSRKLSDVRGQWLKFNDTPLMITFHPSYLIRNNTLRTKRLLWEDMLKIMEFLNLPISEKQRSFFK